MRRDEASHADGWIGKIVRLTTNGDGKGVLSVEISPGILVRTNSTEIGDIGADTLISPDSKVFATLGQMNVGDLVQFSGSFIAETTDCIREGSLTMSGSLTSPEFILRFTDIRPRPY